MATAHSSTARRRWRTRLAVATFRCQRGGEALQHVGAGDLGDRHLADAGEGKTAQARQPLARVSRVAPSARLLFQHTQGGLGEGGDALGASFLGERVSALAGELTVGERLLPGLGQGNEGNAAWEADWLDDRVLVRGDP